LQRHPPSPTSKNTDDRNTLDEYQQNETMEHIRNKLCTLDESGNLVIALKDGSLEAKAGPRQQTMKEGAARARAAKEAADRASAEAARKKVAEEAAAKAAAKAEDRASAEDRTSGASLAALYTAAAKEAARAVQALGAATADEEEAVDAEVEVIEAETEVEVIEADVIEEVMEAGATEVVEATEVMDAVEVMEAYVTVVKVTSFRHANESSAKTLCSKDGVLKFATASSDDDETTSSSAETLCPKGGVRRLRAFWDGGAK